ncbi:MAG: N-acetylmuramic acid 6-phosphate etherase [Gemmatimonadota bacterium]|nr:MAG: N-acetylmuramic acid 6-phosphate etherase [Gemmatimonadota bacterium]
MPDPEFLDPRLTERRNPRTERIDLASSLEIVELMNAEDRLVPAAVHAARQDIARVVDLVVHAFGAGGRLVYVGAGTSGRLGVLDATECPPTFGTPPEMVVGVIAGGLPALTRSQEGAEDDHAAGARAIDEQNVTDRDVVVGIAASGTTPFVNAALARARALGAKTVLISSSDPPEAATQHCDVVVAVRVGPEVLTGSTRLKAGTATKLVLNTITTAAMIRLGKAYGNLMVDLMALSAKLRDRGERIVMEACGVDRDEARRAIVEADGSVKVAVVMARRRVDAAEARRLLDAAGGVVRRAAGDPPEVVG